MSRRAKKTEQYDVIIIGGGSAGLTAGIYCARARLSTVIIEQSLVGGLATYTEEIANYPGFPGGATGNDLMNLFYEQAKEFGVKFKFTDVKAVDLAGEVKRVETFRTDYEGKVVIVATGGKPRLTGMPGEEEYLYDKGISFCATCDAAANTDKDVLVIGSGDSAIEEGMFLTKFARKVMVSVIHDEGKMDCNEVSKEQALANPKMEFIWNTVVDEFIGNDRLETVVLRNLKTGEKIPVKMDTCFLFIGYLPNTELFKGILDMTPNGYLITNEQMETRLEGVYAAGDVRDKFLKQVATAVGDGAIAGYAAEKFIAENEIFHEQIMKTNNKPNLVYVYNAAEQVCRECLAIFEKVEAEESDKAKFIKVDTYKSAGIAHKLGVETTPTLVCVRDGEISETIELNIDEAKIRSFLE